MSLSSMNSTIADFPISFAFSRLLETSLLVCRPEDRQNNSSLFSIVKGLVNPMEASLTFVTPYSLLFICDEFNSLCTDVSFEIISAMFKVASTYLDLRCLVTHHLEYAAQFLLKPIMPPCDFA